MNSTQEPYVSVRDLHFSRQNRRIFSGIDIDVPKGSVVAIMGPSGTGKTTLLRLIVGQLAPLGGWVSVAGQRVSDLSPAGLYRARKKIGMLFQSSALFTDLSVFENVAFPLREHTRLSEAMIRDLVFIKLEAVGLRGARDLMPSELSGGMARRVALARALVLDPPLMLYDEPFTGLDPIAMGVIVKLIRDLNRALGMTSIIVSHDVAETASIADSMYLLSEGRIVGQGSPSEMQQHASLEVQQFMQGLPDGVVPFHYPAKLLREDLGGL